MSNGEPPDKLAMFIQKAGDIGNLLWKGALGAIAIGVMVLIVWELKTGEILETLRSAEVVRGFITFIIALATVAIALILVIAAFLVTNGEKTTLKDRFEMAKGVLTALIGILGTIVGFYFGSEKAKTEQPKPPAIEQVMKVADAKVDNYAPKQGQDITLSFQVTGGKAPYLYTVTFPPKTIDPRKDRKSENGKGSEKIAVPETTPQDTKLTPIKIEVTDSDKKTAAGELKEPEILVKGK